LTGGKDMEGNNLSTVTYATLMAIVKAGNFLGLINSGLSWGNRPGGAAGRLGFYWKLLNDICIYDLVDVMIDVVIDL
jgi:hypothetical protein